jgi:hypothetical protein
MCPVMAPQMVARRKAKQEGVTLAPIGSETVALLSDQDKQLPKGGAKDEEDEEDEEDEDEGRGERRERPLNSRKSMNDLAAAFDLEA